MALSTSPTQSYIKYDPDRTLSEQFQATAYLSAKPVKSNKAKTKVVEKVVKYAPFIMHNLCVKVSAYRRESQGKSTLTYRIVYGDNSNVHSSPKEEIVPATRLEWQIKQIYQQSLFQLIESIEKCPPLSATLTYNPDEHIKKQLITNFSYQIPKLSEDNHRVKLYECAEQYTPLIINTCKLEISAHWHTANLGSQKPEDESDVIYHIIRRKNAQGDSGNAKKENVSGKELSEKITEIHLKSIFTLPPKLI